MSNAHPPVFTSLKFSSSIRFPEIPRSGFPLSESGEFLRFQVIEEEFVVKDFNYFLSWAPEKGWAFKIVTHSCGKIGNLCQTPYICNPRTNLNNVISSPYLAPQRGDKLKGLKSLPFPFMETISFGKLFSHHPLPLYGLMPSFS